MRKNIIDAGGGELTYEIRSIVQIASKLKPFFPEIIRENIGDPIAKGHSMAPWMKDIIAKLAYDDSAYAYSPTKGLDDTRAFLADLNNARGGAQIKKGDIIFFNGLGDAISTIYNYLKKEARVIGNSPAYPTHSSAEAAHAADRHITFKLDPSQGWMPDLDYLRNIIKYNPSIAGILLVNPDNPTGTVYTRQYLEEIVSIARDYDLFIIVDEIYMNLVYNGYERITLAEVIGDVPGISMKGISKEFPWPGARCGWIEVYNRYKDKTFAHYIDIIKSAKMLEVCSTTLPQKAIPLIMSDPRYPEYLSARNKDFEAKSKIAYEIFSDIDGITVQQTKGAFYFTIVFAPKSIGYENKLDISPEKQEIIEPHLHGIAPDKRFVLYMLAQRGICVVPLTGFNSNLWGFRMTLLEPDMDKFKYICSEIKSAIQEYLSSC